jgi:16S rRNA (cytosine967-C5)-methyltransferase
VAASPARVLAHRVLARVLREGAWADRAFRAEADRAGIDARERHFAQRLAYGAIQRLRTIDWVVERVASRPLGEIDPDVLDALRLGVLQLVWLDSVPDRAAVDQTVELVKAATPRAGGFANAVMRRAGREARDLVEGLGDETAEDAALRHSHPDWLAQMWFEQLGPTDARALMETDNEPAESALRVNSLIAAVEEVREAIGDARTVDGMPEALILDTPFDAHGSELFASGAIIPQSRGSMQVARTLDPQPGERVLDLCAAPGAKSTHLAALMRNEGEIVSVEQNPARADELRANAERMRATIVGVRTQDAREIVEAGAFDRVLLDPPCSDLGTLQSRPDARWRKDPETIAELAALQGDLLESALAQLKPGGTLVYSTCTISAAENERRVDAQHAVQLLPHRDGTDGFFIARLERRG